MVSAKVQCTTGLSECLSRASWLKSGEKGEDMQVKHEPLGES